jgi:hypothetical protein
MEKSKFEEMMGRLPSNIKESDVLRLESKKILAALLELQLHSEAKNSGIIYVGNSMLRKLSGVGSSNLLSGIQQLIDYELITRVKGSVRKVQTEKGQASEYRINFKKLKEPIAEKTFDDLFSQFCEESQSLEKPISTTITTTITTSNTTTTSTTTSNSTSIETSNENTTSNSNYFEEFTEDVNKRLVGEDEDELLVKRVELSNNLSRKRIEIGSSLYQRCTSYLNRKYEEAVASI